ncbi:SH3 domain-containing protein [Streptomyces sp. URMC 129]|uniref:SH3 domain-containing protein n=1 Tax=Streptomyces sp. URMC 129 TaxID=3423407 RepID=UPI003F1A9732
MSLLGRLSFYAVAGAVAVAVIAGTAAEEGDADTGPPGAEVGAGAGTELREAPDRDAPPLTFLAQGERVTVICAAEGDAGDAWFLVRTDHYAWAPAADIETHGAATFRC